MSSCGWSRHRPGDVGVATPATWASPPGRRRRSVHRSVEMASRGRFGAFVYTVAPWAWAVGGLGIAIVYTNGRIGPLRAGLGHLCTLLRLARIVRATVGTQECTQIGQNGPSVPFRGIRVHCCDARRDTNRDASCVRWHERLSRHGVPAAHPSLAPLAWSGRQTLREYVFKWFM